MESQDSGFYRSGNARRPRDSASRGRRPRLPSASGFMAAAAAAAAVIFFILWWMLQGEESPWVPAGLAASVVMLVAASAREIVVRRSFARYLIEQDKHQERSREPGESASRLVSMQSVSSHASALRIVQKRSAKADASDSNPEAHLESYRLCVDYLASAEEALRSSGLAPENRVALRSGQDRVRTLQRHHLLTWARSSARTLTREAQQRARLYEKVEVANRALDCIDSALKIYPDEEELNESAGAVREFITSSRVAHWVELAERAAFKGYYRRAIDCYRDALFYLTRDAPTNDRGAAAERVTREIELLRARVATQRAMDAPEQNGSSTTRRRRP
jgi:tetratricopeptide (TPR) repeat protein